MTITPIIFTVFLSLVATYFLRMYAIKRNVMDIPNQRSSHDVPTPRGGGVAIVVCFLSVLVWLMANQVVSLFWSIGLLTAGMMVALIGLMDDHGHIPARWRLCVHMIAASFVLYSLGGLPPLEIVGYQIDLGIPGNLLAVLAMTWVVNLYNFMDGIDGIAGVEAITANLIAGLIMFFIIDSPELAYVNWIMAAAVLGFLFWNFPPAKIFMGDAGSGFLGFVLAAFAVISAQVNPDMFWVWMILLGVFIVDATVTLFRRVIRGQKFYEAHRSHAYQNMSRYFRSHLKVTACVAAINLFFLAPFAIFVALGVIDGIFAVILTYTPLICLAYFLGAGCDEN
ncbi:MraY family glycosyltransferase [Algicola sagamiensis]|uniref:MraY family glycosyltransferase n=1 Tax=Algicola sagamiensis TaxID=163869 RepID=UPI00037AD5FA|nr:glycosyltransferase family 4 protein [Algicola sagamiensis]